MQPNPRLGWITYTPEYAEEHKDQIRECALPGCLAPYIIGFEGDDGTYCSIGCWFAAREGDADADPA